MPLLTESSERTALVLYGSETGRAQDVADELGNITERLHFITRVAEMDSIEPDRLARNAINLVVVSTTGQGDLPENTQRFWKKLLRRRLGASFLQNVRFTVFGLGDSSYPKFNWAGRKLHKRLLQLGAVEFYPRGEGDEQHPEGIDGSFIPWASGLKRHLLETYPCPAGLSPIPDYVLLQPKWILELADNPHSSGDLGDSTQSSWAHQGSPNGHPSDTISVIHSTVDSLYCPSPMPGFITVNLDENARVTPANHWQDVRWLIFSTPEKVDYDPGDVLMIFPKNLTQDVDQLILRMSWSNVADKPLRFKPTSPFIQIQGASSPISHLNSNSVLTLRKLLTDYLDINSIPRRSFFSLIAHFTDNPSHKERLLEFTDPEYLDELYDYTTRPRRSILEVLQEFESVRIPWQWVTTVLPILKGRQFSIASGGALKEPKEGADGSRFELLVAMVKYRTVIKKVREGVCSRYLASLEPGTRLNVLLRRGGLNIARTEAEKPVVMIAPGTGVAPMRSMLWERLKWTEELRRSQNLVNGNNNSIIRPAIGQNVLFFGCRNQEADFFFRHEWETLKLKMDLKVFAAFSRDQKKKIYVQDLVREQSQLVYDLIYNQSGIVYICGSSGRMPQAVREALIEVFQQEGNLDREGAEGYLLKMEKEARYKQETW